MSGHMQPLAQRMDHRIERSRKDHHTIARSQMLRKGGQSRPCRFSLARMPKRY
jgi:hypothetical protein